MEWQCDIIKTRLLTLLDTIRKVIMKIVTNYLSQVMTCYKILKENNFIRLLEGFMEILIKIMNMILEDAKKHNKPV